MSLKEDNIWEVIQTVMNRIDSAEDLSKINSGVKFENYVAMVTEEVAKDYGINVEQTGPQSFPDIIIGDTYGIEVKYTDKPKWQSTGNSIFEGTLRKEVTDQIYLLFGRRVEKKIETRCKKYEECLADIKVTHSPRFFIDMEINENNSILNAIGVTYKEFKGLPDQEKSKRLKKHVKTTLLEGETLWWLDDTQEEAISPKITEFRKLGSSQKQNLINESMILFPEIFSNCATKYLGLSVYLLQEYQIVSSSLRDSFSAGGKMEIVVNDVTYKVSRIYERLYKNAVQIKGILNEMDVHLLQEYWLGHSTNIIVTDHNKLDNWKKMLDKLAYDLPKELKASDIFEEGLKRQF